MREILFRGKSVNGYWIYGNFNFYPDINRTFIRKNNKELLPSFQTSLEEEVSKNTAGQFTGLTDKNGKKIFEGDIVLWCGIKGTVVWEGHKFYIKSNLLWDFSRDDCIEVIGNIHDNPELLRGDTNE